MVARIWIRFRYGNNAMNSRIVLSVFRKNSSAGWESSRTGIQSIAPLTRHTRRRSFAPSQLLLSGEWSTGAKSRSTGPSPAGQPLPKPKSNTRITKAHPPGLHLKPLSRKTSDYRPPLRSSSGPRLHGRFPPIWPSLCILAIPTHGYHAKDATIWWRRNSLNPLFRIADGIRQA
ncbi:MAG: hypothetical protein BWY82_02450 [Verrucomicrobia bacterium ADurb.Bin474]|nr:MAG: hypothetical protein BWY82_02450 [Verrucomicrobia bacterium ADurb.Bin474]